MTLSLLVLMDDQKCFEKVRSMRWPNGVRCTSCDSGNVAKRGMDETQKERQRYRCTDCKREFDDLTGTIFAGHHQPLRVWILCLYFMGLNLSNLQIAQELELDADSAHDMASLLRDGILAKEPEVVLSGKVECDEVYIVAGHKGNPAAVKKRAKRASKAFEGCARKRHIGKREASNLWDDSAIRRGRDSNAGKRSAGYD